MSNLIKLILFIYWLISADIPKDQWQDYYAVANCESSLVPDAVGDGGKAKGLMQIHFNFWHEWAESISKEFRTKDRHLQEIWSNPIYNMQLALLIQENYSLVRHRDRWEQWSAKPYFNC